MGNCRSGSWGLTMISDSCTGANCPVDFVFNLTIDRQGKITGTVREPGLGVQEFSHVKGRCRPGASTTAHMHLLFRWKDTSSKEAGIFLAGMVTGDRFFDGVFGAFTPDNSVPAGGPAQTSRAAPDPGDTGTGGGSQGGALQPSDEQATEK